MPEKRLDLMGCFLIVSALFVPGETLAQRQNPNEIGQGCFSIRVQEPDAPRKSPRRSKEMPSFSASTILDLEFQVRLHRSARVDRVQVKFFTPEGDLYQVQSVPVPPEERRDEEKPRASDPTVSVTLPVAGTTIVSSALYGKWKVEAHVDGALRPCGQALELSILP